MIKGKFRVCYRTSQTNDESGRGATATTTDDEPAPAHTSQEQHQGSATNEESEETEIMWTQNRDQQQQMKNIDFLGNYKGKEAHMKIHEYTFGLTVNTHFWETLGQKNV